MTGMSALIEGSVWTEWTTTFARMESSGSSPRCFKEKAGCIPGKGFGEPVGASTLGKTRMLKLMLRLGRVALALRICGAGRKPARPPTFATYSTIMEYLRTLGSAAASSLLQKSGITLPFALGDKVSYFEGRSIWTLYDATSRVRLIL